MTERRVLQWFLILVAATILSIFLVDHALASALQPHQRAMRAITNPFVTALEVLFAFGISKYVSGAVVVLAGIVAFMARKRFAGWALLLVGLSQLITRLLAGVLKTVFGRLRPYEALAADRWFVDDGNAFPSGHAAHFWGFWFALAMLFPRWRWPLIVIPVLVSLSRVAVNDHYLGDVIGSAAVAAIVTYGFARAFRISERRSPAPRTT